MENTKNVTAPKYAILKAVLILLTGFVPAAVLMLALQATGLDVTAISNELVLWSCLAYAAGSAIMLLIAWRSLFPFREIGFRRPENTRGGAYFWAIAAAHGAFAIILAATSGIRSGTTLGFVMLCLLQTLLIGFCEELMFRGLVYRYLLKFDVSKANLYSSVLFGLVHLVNAVTGATPLGAVLLQVSHALLLGYAAGSLVAVTKSLWPVILWHFLIDFLSMVFDFSILTAGGMAFMAASAAFNVIFALWLWPQVKRVT